MLTSQHPQKLKLSLTAAAVASVLVTACGGGSSSHHSTQSTGSTISGVVTTAAFVPGSATEPTLKASYYAGALVCADLDGNGKCDATENPATTDANGAFTLTVTDTSAPIIADIGTTATITATGARMSSREVLRISADQVTEQAGAVVISPMSAEVLRAMEASSTSYATEKANLAAKLGVDATVVLTDANKVSGTAQTAMLTEANALNNRFIYATTKFDRGDLYPDALAVAGGNPELTGMTNVTAATATTLETRQPITLKEAQQAAFNLEGIPRYDNIFIVMLENKGTNKILNSPYAPNINGYLSTGNQFTSYFATGKPSEPNYLALGAGDDFGIIDDNQWNCDATGDTAVQDLPLPDNTQPGLASSPFKATCINGKASHNVIGKPNLFNALTAAGMSWRTYNESMNPGQDVRTDSVADSAVTASDYYYADIGDGTSAGDSSTTLTMPSGLYKTKHHPGMAYQNVRSAPEWKYSNRTMGGGQWDASLKNSSAYAIPAGYDYDQLGTDLQSGDVGSINFLMPDQCDDMHGISNAGGTCGGNAIIKRGDEYVKYVVSKIQSSALWQNPQRKVAIVLMFDEGSATAAYNSCCGWNPNKSTDTTAPLKQDANGNWVPDTSIDQYGVGNRGHGESIFGVLTNQPDAPKGVSDSDAYSHFSFVRTLQDMFQLADPEDDASYMNRSKYTEKFIAQNILNLPEYAGSADTHFDSVRPMNHAYVIPAGYVQKQSSDVATAAQVGPDASQTNVWALHK